VGQEIRLVRGQRSKKKGGGGYEEREGVRITRVVKIKNETNGKRLDPAFEKRGGFKSSGPNALI